MLKCENDKKASYKLSAAYDLDRDIELESNEGAKFVVINLDISAVEPQKLFVDNTELLRNDPIESKSEDKLITMNEEITNFEDRSDKNPYKSMQNSSKEKATIKKHKGIQKKDIGTSNNILDIAIVLFLLMIIRP